MRKYSSNAASLINNVNSYNYIIIYDPKLKDIIIERFNYKNIYIYYVDCESYDFIFLYNKSNKFHRFMIRQDKTTSSFTLINDFFDTKVRDYFIFTNFYFIPIVQYSHMDGDNDIIDVLKKIDI
jgi:hypothetical protein